MTLLNPYNEREFIGDKLTIVDVKAIDESGKMYQIEIQLAMHMPHWMPVFCIPGAAFTIRRYKPTTITKNSNR